ncbi:MAG: YggT family protein [Clostridia bacterium]|nr:YggT family protein [Clostridia bacterium]
MSDIIGVVNLFFQILWWLVIARILLSWLPNPPHNQLIKFIYQATDPILVPFQRLIPPIGMIDISPMVALFALELVRKLVISLLAGSF